MKIYLLLAHPDKESFNNKLADAYEQAALRNGHEVRRQNIGDLVFDPVLRNGYKKVQELEPDLKQAQENILWCNHWVIFYPVWWGSVPALFKGFLDRVLYPGFAFRYHDKGMLWDKLLKGRSAQVITTSDAPWWWLWLQYRNSDINTVRNATLKFCGITPVKLTRIDKVKYMADAQKEKAVMKVVRGVPK